MTEPDLTDFSLPSTGGGSFRLAEHRGKLLVLYFYPKDNTPGCTTEGMRFRDLHADFAGLGCAVFGISRDGIKSHESFKRKLELPFDLLSDEQETACTLFAVIKLKNMYGKQVRGIERSTFVIGRDGRIARAWRGVKVAGHVEEVLDFVRTLQP
jgi:peroxiredoxin Q/BCP